MKTNNTIVHILPPETASNGLSVFSRRDSPQPRIRQRMSLPDDVPLQLEAEDPDDPNSLLGSHAGDLLMRKAA